MMQRPRFPRDFEGEDVWVQLAEPPANFQGITANASHERCSN